jgi:hypothetical protein
VSHLVTSDEGTLHLSWDGDEPSTATAEEVSAPAAEESAPHPQAETVAPVTEATLPEASVVEGECACSNAAFLD